MSSYPYESAVAAEVAEAKARGRAVDEWRASGVNIAAIITSLKTPILEIGGPTDTGYYFLHDTTLPSEVIISNITPDAHRFSPDAATLNAKITQHINGRNIPYPDNTVGMILSAHISLIDEGQYDFAELTPQQEKQLWQDIDRANAAIARVVQQNTIDDSALKLSLRLGIASEVYRVLQSGGLYITDATYLERKAYELVGFTELATLNINSLSPELDSAEPYYDIVLQKLIDK